MKDVMPEAKVLDEAVVLKRRAQLVKVASRLFIERGFHKTSVRDIAEALGWQKGTLYLYFRQKEDILFLVGKEIFENQERSLTDHGEQPTHLETLQKSIHSYYTALHRDRLEINLLYRDFASALPEHREWFRQAEVKVRTHFVRLLELGEAAGEFTCRMQHDLLAHNVIMLGHMWALKQWGLSQFLSIEEYIEGQLQLLMSQLALPEAAS